MLWSSAEMSCVFFYFNSVILIFDGKEIIDVARDDMTICKQEMPWSVKCSWRFIYISLSMEEKGY